MNIGETYINSKGTIATVIGLTTSRVKYTVKFASNEGVFGPWLVSFATFNKEFATKA